VPWPVTSRKVSDRTFLLHLGGKIEVRSKVQLRSRGDLLWVAGVVDLHGRRVQAGGESWVNR